MEKEAFKGNTGRKKLFDAIIAAQESEVSLPSQQSVNHESSSLLDRLSARFETILVTVFSLAMTLSISLEIVRDAFRAPDSRLAKFFGIAELPTHMP